MKFFFAENRITIILFLFIAVVSIIFHYLSSFLQDEKKQLVKIGVVIPQTEEFTQSGKDMLRTAELLVDEFSKNHSKSNYDIKLEIMDDQGDIEQAISIASKFIEDQSIIAVVGHSTSEIIDTVAPLYKEAKLPLINSIVHGVGVISESNWFFHTRLNSIGIGTLQAKYVLETEKLSQIYVIYDKSTAKSSITANSFVKTIEKSGIKVKSWDFDSNASTLDENLDTIIKRKLYGKNSGHLFISAPAEVSADILHKLRKSRTKLNIIGSPEFGTEEFISKLRNTSNEWKKELNNISFGKQFIREMMGEEETFFEINFQNQFRKIPNESAYFMYDAMQFVIQGILNTNPNSDRIEHRKDFREILLSHKKQIKSFKGIVSPFYFNRRGEAMTTIKMATFQDGQVIPARKQYVPSLDKNKKNIYIWGQFLRMVDVIHTGIVLHDIGEISRFGEYVELEFELWLRGQSNLPIEDIYFLNGGNKQTELKIEKIDTINDLKYVRYLVKDKFSLGASLIDNGLNTQNFNSIDIQFLNSALKMDDVIFLSDFNGMQISSGLDALHNLKKLNLLENPDDWLSAHYYFKNQEQDHLGELKYITNPNENQIGQAAFSLSILSSFSEGAFQGLIPDNKEITVLVVSSMLLILFLYLIGIDNGKHNRLLFTPLVFLMVSVLFASKASLAITQVYLTDYLYGLSQIIGVILLWWDIVWWLAFGLLMNLSIDSFIWNKVKRDSGREVPSILKTTVQLLILMFVVFAIAAFVFELSILGALAASSAIFIPIGMALNPMILDLFAGLVINIDQPFRINDWIQIHEDGDEPIIGCVVGESWRTLQLRTAENTMISIPNHKLSEVTLTNFSTPTPKSRFEFTFNVLYDVPQGEVIRLAMNGLRAVEEAGDILPPSKVRVNGMTERGIEYLVRYYQDLSKGSPSKGRGFVTSAIIKHLAAGGIRPSYAIEEEYDANISAASKQYISVEGRQQLLTNVDLFSGLDDEAVQMLSENCEVKPYGAGEMLTKQGDDAKTMFVVVEGLFGIYLNNSNGLESQVDTLHLGQYFGTSSIITGEKRTVSVSALVDGVILEINYLTINQLIKQDPNIIDKLEQKIKSNNEHYAEELANDENQTHAFEDKKKGSILNKMKVIMPLSKPKHS